MSRSAGVNHPQGLEQKGGGASWRLAGVWRLLAPALLAGLFAGCSWMPFVGGDKDEEEEDVNATEQLLYRNAQRSLRAGNYDRAVTALERLEARFPFGRYAHLCVVVHLSRS